MSLWLAGGARQANRYARQRRSERDSALLEGHVVGGD